MPRRLLLESDLEDRFMAHLASDPCVLRCDRQVDLGEAGRADVVAIQEDEFGPCRVVFELKVVAARRRDFGQLYRYLGWYAMHDHEMPLAGSLIAPGLAEPFRRTPGVPVLFLDFTRPEWLERLGLEAV